MAIEIVDLPIDSMVIFNIQKANWKIFSTNIANWKIHPSLMGKSSISMGHFP